jgi:myosin heavy subunit
MSDTYTPGAGLADELDDDEKAYFESADTGEETPAEAPAVEPTAEEPAVETAVEPLDEDGLEPDDIHEDVNKGRFIRHGAFHRERKMRQEIERQLSTERAELTRQREERARIDERLQLIMQASQQQVDQQQQEQAPAVPDPEENPFAYMRYLESQIAQLSQHNQGVSQHFQRQDEYASVKSAFQADANSFTQQQPDFIHAYQHLIRARDRELQRLGRVDPQERARIINQEELMIVGEALRGGKSAAQLMYELAKDRGYQTAPVEAQAAPAAAAAPAQRPSAVAQVAAIKAGTQAARSLGSAAGGSNQPLTAELLASMSESEFEAVYSKMNRDQRREYFGG